MREAVRIGIDVDGVLANFNEAFRELIFTVTGKVLKPFETDGPLTWNWDRDQGVTREEEDACWRAVEVSPHWWCRLKPLPGVHEALGELQECIMLNRVEPFFITARRGPAALNQTRQWLRNYGICYPTVLPGKDPVTKAALCKVLGLHTFIDDKVENVLAIAGTPKTRAVMHDWNYNRRVPEFCREFTRVPDFPTFINKVITRQL